MPRVFIDDFFYVWGFGHGSHHGWIDVDGLS